MEKVKEFFTPSYWLGSVETTGDDGQSHAEDETQHIFNPLHSHPSDPNQAPQSDIIGDTQSDNPVPGLSISKKSSGQAWKSNMIVLNDDAETGPSQLFQNEAGSSAMRSTESTTVNALHNTKLFIPASLNSPQHSTPLKKNEQTPMHSGGDPSTVNVSNEMDTLPEQHEATTSSARKEHTEGCSATTLRQLELHHQSGSMLTPPGIIMLYE